MDEGTVFDILINDSYYIYDESEIRERLDFYFKITIWGISRIRKKNDEDMLETEEALASIRNSKKFKNQK